MQKKRRIVEVERKVQKRKLKRRLCPTQDLKFLSLLFNSSSLSLSLISLSIYSSLLYSISLFLSISSLQFSLSISISHFSFYLASLLYSISLFLSLSSLQFSLSISHFSFYLCLFSQLNLFLSLLHNSPSPSTISLSIDSSLLNLSLSLFLSLLYNSSSPSIISYSVSFSLLSSISLPFSLLSFCLFLLCESVGRLSHDYPTDIYETSSKQHPAPFSTENIQHIEYENKSE